MDRATTEQRRLFEHDRLQAKFVGGQSAGQPGDARPQDHDIVRIIWHRHRHTP
jgi:hypothetical protein